MICKRLKKIVCFALCAAMVLSFTACNSKEETTGNAGQDADSEADAQNSEDDGEAAVLNIAYQYGLAYAPLIIAQTNKTIEAAYEESEGKKVTVNWIQMNSGADINTGIASGDIDVGFMGVGPAITGVAKNVGYKIFTNLSGQDHGMMVNDDSIKSLSDIVGTSSQIAVVNIGSIQHIILAMALENEGLDPHVLDDNLIAMKHPDGMTSLISGNVAGHVTSSPYIYKEQADSSLHSIDAVANAWKRDNSFIVGVASEKLHSENGNLYKALCQGISEAMDFINKDTDKAAELTYEFNGNTLEEEKEYLAKGSYNPETKGIGQMAKFMFDNGFVDVNPGEYKDIVFDNVVGD